MTNYEMLEQVENALMRIWMECDDEDLCWWASCLVDDVRDKMDEVRS